MDEPIKISEINKYLKVGDVITLGDHYSVPKHISKNKIKYVIKSIAKDGTISLEEYKHKY